MKILSVILEFILYLFLLSMLGAPFALIVYFPNEAEYFTRIGEKLIPWGVLLLLLAIFSDAVKSFVSKIIQAIDRVKSISAAGTALELNPQGLNETVLSEEQIQALRTHIQELSQQQQDSTNLASHFFLKFIGATIYGSQFKLLEALEKSNLSPNRVVSFYNQFLSKAPDNTDYPFDKWVEYMTSNLLIQFDETTSEYTITPAGTNVLKRVREANLTSETFNY